MAKPRLLGVFALFVLSLLVVAFLLGRKSNTQRKASSPPGARASLSLAGKTSPKPGQCGNYWPQFLTSAGKVPPGSRILRDSVRMLRSSVGVTIARDFADIKVARSLPSWHQLTPEERKQVIELGFVPQLLGRMIYELRLEGFEVSKEELRERIAEKLKVERINVFKCRPVDYFAEQFSPGDVFLRLLEPAEFQDYLKKNRPYDRFIDCPRVGLYWRIYGEKGLIVERVVDIDYTPEGVRCLRRKLGLSPQPPSIPTPGIYARIEQIKDRLRETIEQRIRRLLYLLSQ